MKKILSYVLVLAMFFSVGINNKPVVAYGDEIADTFSQDIVVQGMYTVDVYFVLEGKEVNDDKRSADCNKMEVNYNEYFYLEYILENFHVEEAGDYTLVVEQVLRRYSQGEKLNSGESVAVRRVSNGIPMEVVILSEEITDKDFNLEYAGLYRMKFSPEFIYDNGSVVLAEWLGDYIVPEIVEINSVSDYNKFAEQTTNGTYSLGKLVVLNNDLDFQGMEFVPIEYFDGIFIGNNHTMKNIAIDSTYSNSGVFRHVGRYGQIQGLTVDISMDYSENRNIVGGIVGENKGIIAGCKVTGSVSGNENVGGIVGVNSFYTVQYGEDSYIYCGEVVACDSYAVVTGGGNVGGIAGANKGSIRMCNNYGKVNNSGHMNPAIKDVVSVGGITGFHGGADLTACGNFDVVGSSDMSFVGGIAGTAFGNVWECENDGRIFGKDYVGGVVGHFGDFTTKVEFEKIQDVPNAYKLITMNGMVSDIAPEKLSVEDLLHWKNLLGIYPLKSINYGKSILFSLNQGTVIGNYNVGGIVGYFADDVDSVLGLLASINTGKIISELGNVGGIIGNHSGARLERCFNTGEILSEKGSYVGGIAGISNEQIAECYSIATVEGENYVGGIVGSGRNVEICYSSGIVQCNGSYVGSIAGKLSGTATFNYFLNDEVGGIDNVSQDRSAVSLNVHEISSSNGRLPQKMTGFGLSVWQPKKQGEGFLELGIFYNSDGLGKIDGELHKLMISISKSSTVLDYEIKFIDENDELIESVMVLAGDKIAPENLPKVPEKSGYYGIWGEFETEGNESIKSVKPVYVLQANMLLCVTDSGLNVKVMGSFHPDTIITVKSNIMDPPHVIDGYAQRAILEIEAELEGVDIDLKGHTVILEPEGPVKNLDVGLVVGNTVDQYKSNSSGGAIEYKHNGKLKVSLFYEDGYPLLSWRNFSFLVTIIIIVAGTFFETKKLVAKNKAKAEANEKAEIFNNKDDDNNTENKNDSSKDDNEKSVFYDK